MKLSLRWLLPVSLLALTAFLPLPASTFSSFVSFNGANGSHPTGMVVGGDGTVYGATYQGGPYGLGTVWKISPAGVITRLVSFNGKNGSFPAYTSSGLIVGGDGAVYGSTTRGGANDQGTIWKISPAGVFTTLFSFTGANGGDPDSGLVLGRDGAIYGTTRFGGTKGLGTVWKLSPEGVFTSLVSFVGPNGNRPGSCVLGNDGAIYGTTVRGGTKDLGTLWKISPAGVFTSLVSFTGANGSGPSLSRLVVGGDGSVYGTTSEGGSKDLGTIWKVSPAGVASLTSTPSALDGPAFVTVIV